MKKKINKKNKKIINRKKKNNKMYFMRFKKRKMKRIPLKRSEDQDERSFKMTMKRSLMK